MGWTELERKTKIIFALLAIAVLFAGTIIAGAFLFFKKRGGSEIAQIVSDSVKAERITQGQGVRIVSDQIIVSFRPGTSESKKREIAEASGVQLENAPADRPEDRIVKFRPITWMEIKKLIEGIERYPDVLDAEFIPVD